jgi:hypothetical protein
VSGEKRTHLLVNDFDPLGEHSLLLLNLLHDLPNSLCKLDCISRTQQPSQSTLSDHLVLRGGSFLFQGWREREGGRTDGEFGVVSDVRGARLVAVHEQDETVNEVVHVLVASVKGWR